jgi:predicted nucleic-acid-binding protein
LIGIDTNVLIRYITQDDPHQSKIANRFIESLSKVNPGFISLVSLVEFCWVLNRSYNLSRQEFVRALLTLAKSESFIIELEWLVRDALSLFENSNADFGDCLIAKCVQVAGCNSVVTFDRKAAKSLGMKLLG